MSRRSLSLILASAMLALSACSTHMSGKANDGSLSSAEFKESDKASTTYTGTQYNIGIIRFENRAPEKVSGDGGVASSILETQLKTAGLKAISLVTNPLSQIDQLATLTPASSFEIRQADSKAGIVELDYSLSGAITSYSEVEEGIDTIVFQKKVVVARITIEYALIDLVTGKSLVTESVAGEYRKNISGTSSFGAKAKIGPNLRDGALRDALGKVTKRVVQDLSSTPFHGKILAVNSQGVVLKAGSRSLLEEGDQLEVYHLGEAIFDLNSRKIIGYLESMAGVIEINKHQSENLSEASIVSGSVIHAGDIARQIP